MTTQTEPKTNETTEQIRTVQARLGLSQKEMAMYLGVPHGTLCNWLQGTREPSVVVKRLLYVLGTVEALAPALHSALVPERK